MAADHILTGASTLACPHPPAPGKITITESKTLRVAGKGVLTLAAAASATTGCTQPQQTGPPPTDKCKTVSVSEVGAARLRVDGSAVLLDGTFTATTNGLPPAVRTPPVPPVPPAVPITVTANQTLLRAE